MKITEENVENIRYRLDHYIRLNVPEVKIEKVPGYVEYILFYFDRFNGGDFLFEQYYLDNILDIIIKGYGVDKHIFKKLNVIKALNLDASENALEIRYKNKLQYAFELGKVI